MPAFICRGTTGEADPHIANTALSNYWYRPQGSAPVCASCQAGRPLMFGSYNPAVHGQPCQPHGFLQCATCSHQAVT